MSKIKSFSEYINETYLEKPISPEVLNFDKKKMLKNGYIEVSVIVPVDDLKKGDDVLVSSTEFGQLDKDAFVTCYKDKDEIIIPKKNLRIVVK